MKQYLSAYRRVQPRTTIYCMQEMFGSFQGNTVNHPSTTLKHFLVFSSFYAHPSLSSLPPSSLSWAHSRDAHPDSLNCSTHGRAMVGDNNWASQQGLSLEPANTAQTECQINQAQTKLAPVLKPALNHS